MARIVAEDLVCYTPDVISQSDYYPFGMALLNTNFDPQTASILPEEEGYLSLSLSMSKRKRF